MKILKENTKNNQKELNKIIEDLKEDGMFSFKSSLSAFKNEMEDVEVLRIKRYF